MIVPMVKYDFLLYHGDLGVFLNSLQDLGVVDIESHGVVLDEVNNNLLLRSKRCEIIQKELKALKRGELATEFRGSVDDILSEFDRLKERLSHLDAHIKKTEKDIDDAIKWGDFYGEDLVRLRKMGFIPHFYEVSPSKFIPEWENRYALTELNRDGSKIYFVILHPDDEELDFELVESRFPEKSYKILIQELKEAENDRQKAMLEMEGLTFTADQLEEERVNLIAQVDFNQAKFSAKDGADGSLKLLTGWVPKPRKEELNQFLARSEVYYVSEEKPAPDESLIPPVLLKNNGFARLFEPITRVYSLPKYTELDPTPLFAPFYMLFFGFCLGDGGYGIIILLIASLLKLKFKQGEVRNYLGLVQFLGASTILFGLITGTFWGITFDSINFAQKAETHFGLPPNYSMLYLALLLGVIQILFGMAVKVVNITLQHGFKYALSDLAWLILILLGGAYFTLGTAIPMPIYYLLGGVSALLIVFYNLPGKNIFINFGNSIWVTYQTASGLLGDILSYIRLFALGMTGGILGGVFNKLATDAGSGIGIPVVGFIITLIVLLFGHTLNLLLNTLGAIVHPLRLTFVEYYKNSGFEGGGREYKPLKRK